MKRKYKIYFIYFFRFLNNKGTITLTSTIGNPNYFALYKLTDGSLVHVNILDTAGQEKFKALNENYYKKASCCLLVYDITDKNSFEECKNYYNETIKEKCKENIKVVLLGNKTDLEDQRQVPSEEGANFASKNNYTFLETSCLKNTNVAGAFETLIEMTNIDSKKEDSEQKGAKLNPNEHKKKGKCGC